MVILIIIKEDEEKTSTLSRWEAVCVHLLGTDDVGIVVEPESLRLRVEGKALDVVHVGRMRGILLVLHRSVEP